MERNPRFEDDALGAFREPDIKKIACKDCVWRKKDNEKLGVKGATLAICEVYGDVLGLKPNEILWDNEPCPYYVSEDDSDEEDS